MFLLFKKNVHKLHLLDVNSNGERQFIQEALCMSVWQGCCINKWFSGGVLVKRS